MVEILMIDVVTYSCDASIVWNAGALSPSSMLKTSALHEQENGVRMCIDAMLRTRYRTSIFLFQEGLGGRIPGPRLVPKRSPGQQQC